MVVLAVAGAIALVVWWPSGGSAADAPYRLAPVDRGAITASVRATGTLNPVTTVLVGSQLSGQVVEILVDYNSPVQAGQVLARLDSTQIRARRDASAADVQQARADLAMRRAQVDRTRATRERAKANLRDLLAQRDRVNATLADAQRTLQRQTELIGRNITSQQAFDAARTQSEVQKASLASIDAQVASQEAEIVGLEADIALAAANVESAQAAVQQREAKLRDSEIDLSRTDIKSPVDGVVVQRQIDLGQTVAASLQTPTLFTVAQDLRGIEIWANVDEADVGRIKAGQRVTFTVNAYPTRTFEGAVKLVRLGAQTVSNVVTYTGVVTVANVDLALLPGMTANLQVITDERNGVLRVPNAALRFRPAGITPPAPPTPAGQAAAAVDGPPRGGGGGGGRSFEAMRERIVAEVQPTPEQSAAIARILAERRGNMPGREPGLTDDDRRAAFRQFREEMQAKIAAVLDPERRAKYLAMSEGRGARGGDGGAPGRVFVLDGEGRPQGLALRIGATDGSYTEVLAGDVKEGTGVIVGGGPRPQGGAQETSPMQRPRGPRLF
jgi:HlyD family secretion protein